MCRQHDGGTSSQAASGGRSAPCQHLCEQLQGVGASPQHSGTTKNFPAHGANPLPCPQTRLPAVWRSSARCCHCCCCCCCPARLTLGLGEKERYNIALHTHATTTLTNAATPELVLQQLLLPSTTQVVGVSLRASMRRHSGAGTVHAHCCCHLPLAAQMCHLVNHPPCCWRDRC
jgi:hypothetical protein